ncbi:P-loop containing nucleoside triphosphate hydrolase protein [Stachybotrys elegans]|uniref:P-loop containing nucleoside triphosphate hydrolase protein n=1 Tax=Stachybotrys elegans TaxID=80388 RepID=A0A8K0WQV4_9HYPO|nr:P-loop containing nucleoside triphosphate hydrolase protein [Stachybotrys elegans]
MFHQVIDNFQNNFKVDFDPPPYSQARFLVPFDRNPSFVGRKVIFDAIERELDVPEGTQPKAALCGLGGIGKSQIALEYCYRMRKKDERCSIFWCNAATSARFEESMNRIANECGIVSKEDGGTDAAALLKDWLEYRHQDPWLMVVDNVDDEDAFFREKTRIGKTPSECIPHSAQGTLLFTTRSRDIAFDVASTSKPILIQEMEREEGLKLIRKRLPTDTPEDTLITLLEVLEFIPLAITQAVAFITKRRKTVRQYLEQYQKSDATRTKLLSYEFSDHGRQGSSMESLAKTWMLSFEAIRESNPRAAELLCLITFFQHQGVPAVLLQSDGEDEFDFQDAVAVLKAFSFIDADEADTAFSTHRLVQLATRWWLEKEMPSETDKWATAALKSVAMQFPEPNSHPDTDYFTLSEILLPHAELVLRYEFKSVSKEADLYRARLLNSSGRYIHWTGSFDEARARFAESMNINMKHLGEKHVDTMISTGLLGWTLGSCDEDPHAIPILERLVEIRKEVLGEDDPLTIDAMSDLATAIVTTGDLSKAESMQREALARSERVLGRHHGDTLNCMEHLSSILDDQGNAEEAIMLEREVYTTKRAQLGPRHMSVLVAECNLATMLGDEGHVEEAHEMFKRNIEVKREVCGVDHRETLVSIMNFGTFLLRSQSGRREAKELFTQALQDAEDGPRKNNPKSQDIIHTLRRWLRLWRLQDSSYDTGEWE